MSSQEYILQDLHSSCQFNQSFVMNPIVLNSQESFFKKNQYSRLHNKNTKIFQNSNDPSNLTRNQQAKNNKDEYQQYKLNQYLLPDDDYEFESQSSRYKNNANRSHGHSIIEILNIDPESLVVEMNYASTDGFAEVIKKYSAYDITFVSVVGEKGSGKSMFCDKVLNLADVKGNNFCKNGSAEKIPGLYMWERPFIKENICIFFIEIANCGINDTTFRILNTLSMMISSQYILVNSCADKEQKSLKQFSECLKKSLKALDLPDNYKTKNYLPHFLHNLYRYQIPKSIPSSPDQNSMSPFTNVYPHYLPSAKAASYKGPDTDLVQLPFSIKSIINPQYIHQISNIFKSVYKLIHHNKILLNSSNDQLILNSNIILKILEHSITQLNSKKKIRVDKMYDNILKQLYISAYNYCVMCYHEDLGEYFGDEEPKPLESILEIFEKTKNQVLDQFKKYNISKKLHEQFERKLQAHIDAKQQLLLSINRQKIQQKLSNHLAQTNVQGSDPQTIVKTLKSLKNQLNDGRQNITKQFLCQLYRNSSGSGVDYKVQRQIEKLSKQVEIKQQQLKKAKKKKADERSNNDKIHKQYSKLKQEENQLTKQIEEAKKDIQLEKKKAESIKQGRGLQEMISQRQKLYDEKTKNEQLRKKLNNENPQQMLNQLTEKKRKQIDAIIGQQRVIQEKLKALKSQAPNSTVKGSNVKPKMTESKAPKQSASKDSKLKNSNTKPTNMKQSNTKPPK